MAGCDHCRAIVRQAKEQVAGALFGQEAPEPSPDALAEARRRLAAPSKPLPVPSLNLSERQMLPLGAGAWYRPLARSGDARLIVLYLAPGARFPEHRHNALELMLVLKGGMVVNGTAYGTMDICDVPAGEVHAPETLGDTPCLCLCYLGKPLVYRSPLLQLRARLIGL